MNIFVNIYVNFVSGIYVIKYNNGVINRNVYFIGFVIFINMVVIIVGINIFIVFFLLVLLVNLYIVKVVVGNIVKCINK